MNLSYHPLLSKDRQNVVSSAAHEPGQMWGREHMEKKSPSSLSLRLCALGYVSIFTVDLGAYVFSDIHLLKCSVQAYILMYSPDIRLLRNLVFLLHVC